MGEVVSLSEWRARKLGSDPTPVGRLDAAVARLDGAISQRIAAGWAVPPGIAEELHAIARAVSARDLDQAAERARRLAARLEHPAVRRA